MKKSIIVFILLLLALHLSAHDIPTQSYVYTSFGEDKATAESYYVADKFYPQQTEQRYEDLFIKDGTLYILTSDGKLVTSVGGGVGLCDKNGNAWPFLSPSGLFISDSLIYVSDSEAGAVFAFDRTTNIHEFTISEPNSSIYDADVPFCPSGVLADRAGNVYVLIPDLYYGAVLFSSSQEFLGYYGANPTELTITQRLDQSWKKLMNRQQRDAMERFVPVAYSGFDIDETDFVYTCSANISSEGMKIRKINPSGKGLWDDSEYHFGDIFNGEETVNGLSSETRFVDIDVSNGFIYALDAGRGRIFIYDDNGNLLSVFAGMGSQKGTFQDPVAIESNDEHIYVLDAKDSSVTVFNKTYYGSVLSTAVSLFSNGLYSEALPYWEIVSSLSPSFELAHLGKGRAYAKMGENQLALEELRLSQNHIQYSAVFEKIRLQLIRDILPAIIIGFFILVIAFYFLKKKYFQRLALPDRLHLHKQAFFHPVDTLWDMRRKQQFSWLFPSVLLILFFFMDVLQFFSTGFIFNENNLEDFNLLLSIMGTIGLYLLVCTVNYAVSAISDGKGSFKDIYASFAYALIPILIAGYLNLILSNVLTLDEGNFMDYISIGAGVWSFVLLLFIASTIHEYEFGTVLKNFLFTVIGCLFVVFLLFLAIILVEHTVNIFSIIYNEIVLRR